MVLKDQGGGESPSGEGIGFYSSCVGSNWFAHQYWAGCTIEVKGDLLQPPLNYGYTGSRERGNILNTRSTKKPLYKLNSLVNSL